MSLKRALASVCGIWLSVSAALLGAQTVPPKYDPAQWIKELRDPDPATARRTLERLQEILRDDRKWKPSLPETTLLLRAAVEEYPAELRKGDDGHDEVQSVLVNLASRTDHDVLPLIEEVFPRLDNYARDCLVGAMVGTMETPKAAECFMRLVRKHARTGKLTTVAMQLTWSPKHVRTVFPELLQYTDVAELTDDIFHVAKGHLLESRLDPQVLVPYAERIVARTRAAVGRAEKLRAVTVEQVTQKSDSDAFNQLLYCIELLQFLPGDAGEQELRDVMDFRDPTLGRIAIAGLIRKGCSVEPGLIEKVAASQVARFALFRSLAELKRVDLMPKRYQTQASLAESALVEWLSWPTELNKPPDRIELMKIVTATDPKTKQINDIYLFRYRTLPPHWAAEKGWLVGFAGPFERAKAPTTESTHTAFSTFATWDEQSPAEHVQDVLGIVEYENPVKISTANPTGP